jgi:hypothetical protein
MDMLKLLQNDLEKKELELKEKQEYLSIMAQNEYQIYSFERNTICDLLTIGELKTEIRLIKHYIMILNMSTK